MREDIDKKESMPPRSSEKPSYIPERLRPQITHLLKMIGDVNKSRKYPRPPEEQKFIEHFFDEYIKERYERSTQVNSAEVREAVDIAEKLFPYPVYGVFCIDGRVLPPLVAGMMAKFGGFMRLPGGDLKEFVMGRDGKLALLKDSNFAHQLDHTMVKYDEKIELLDSHVGCAARKQEEVLGTGLAPKDGGLLADVERKKEIGDATTRYVSEKHPGKRVIPIQFSFDPHNGYGYMGLETDKAMSHAREKGGFTHEVLEELYGEGRILSTEKMAKLPEMRAAFEQWTKSFGLDKRDENGKPEFDWANNYAKSALGFWKAMLAMKDQLLPIIRDEILEIFPHLNGKDEKLRKEVDERALILLANAYCGYLNNLIKYKYGEHDEACVVVTEREHGPFAHIPSFIVFSGELKSMPYNVVFASSIVRQNRETGRTKDPVYDDPAKHEDYIKAPVPVIVHEIVRDEVDPKTWAMLEKVDWEDMEELVWRNMTTEEFLGYLVKKLPNLPTPLALAIDRLRQKMTFLYNPEKDSARHLVDGNLVAMPMIVDKNRCPHAIIPFIKKGFHT